MGKLIMPKHAAELVYIHSAMKVYYDARSWVSSADYKDRLSSILQSIGKEQERKGDDTHYTKCSEIPRYFGFLERKIAGKATSDVRITDNGIKYYEGVLHNDTDAIYDAIMNALENVTFGRNNEGVGSDNDYEIPCIIILSSLLLPNFTNMEASLVIGQLVNYNENLASALLKVEYKRRNPQYALSSNITTDIKFVAYLKRIGFFDNSVSFIQISQTVKGKYYSRLIDLPITNNLKSASIIKLGVNKFIPSPIIMYGPPGTGKTFRMQQDYISKFSESDRFVATFHQSFSYEEFVEGLKPVLDTKDEANDIKYTIEDGVLKKACEKAAIHAGYATLEECIKDTPENRMSLFTTAINKGKSVLLCIDEINRGNVASIFGDLISLVEPSKRLGSGDNEMTVILPYSKKSFGVPANLIIVGTMNTADRSIQLLDTALRRRFKFKELLPDYSVFVDDDPTIQAVKNDAKAILENINGRIRCLLNKDNQIGHSYFMFAKSHKDIFEAIVNKIIPLLEEYFYNDIPKVRFVLNEDNSTTYAFYKEDEIAQKAFEAYIRADNIDVEGKPFFKLAYIINDDADYTKYLAHLLGKPEDE